MVAGLMIVVYYLIQCPNFPPLDPGGWGCNDSILGIFVIAVAFPCSMLATITVCCCPMDAPRPEMEHEDGTD